MSVFLFSMNIDGKVLFMIISQGFTFATSLNLKKPIQDKTQIKTVRKFERHMGQGIQEWTK